MSDNNTTHPNKPHAFQANNGSPYCTLCGSGWGAGLHRSSSGIPFAQSLVGSEYDTDSAPLTCGDPHCDLQLGHAGPHHCLGGTAVDPTIMPEAFTAELAGGRDRGEQIAAVIVTLTVCLAMLAILGSALYLIIR